MVPIVYVLVVTFLCAVLAMATKICTEKRKLDEEMVEQTPETECWKLASDAFEADSTRPRYIGKCESLPTVVNDASRPFGSGLVLRTTYFSFRSPV